MPDVTNPIKSWLFRSHHSVTLSNYLEDLDTKEPIQEVCLEYFI